MTEASMTTKYQPFPAVTSMENHAWYCLRTQSKREHVAAGHLRRILDEPDIFNPQLTVRRETRRGAAWFVEALFPGYLFARFDPCRSIELIKNTRGVKAIVGFGALTPSLSDAMIEELSTEFAQDPLQKLASDIHTSRETTLACGPFQGTAKALRGMSAARRVQMLLEILGCTLPVEIARQERVAEKPEPHRLTTTRPRLRNMVTLFHQTMLE